MVDKTFSGSYFKFERDVNYAADEVLMKQVKEQLEKHRVLIVNGHSGTGKTSLANELAHRLKDTFTVWWIDSQNKVQLEACILDLLPELSDRGKKIDRQHP